MSPFFYVTKNILKVSCTMRHPSLPVSIFREQTVCQVFLHVMGVGYFEEAQVIDY